MISIVSKSSSRLSADASWALTVAVKDMLSVDATAKERAFFLKCVVIIISLRVKVSKKLN
jgi:hypothetical protein